MRFCIAPLSYFNSLGFDTTHWRKSLDESLAICHVEFALTLADESMLDIYAHDDPEFLDIINGKDWVEQTEEEDVE